MSTYDDAFSGIQKKLSAFTRSYIETLMWSENDESTDQGGEPFDRNYSLEDIHPDSLETIQKECDAFQEKMSTSLPWKSKIVECIHVNDIAHNFVLTRNGHGAGFWDGDYDHLGKDTVDFLCKLSKGFHPCHLILGDDGHIHYWTEWKGN